MAKKNIQGNVVSENTTPENTVLENNVLVSKKESQKKLKDEIRAMENESYVLKLKTRVIDLGNHLAWLRDVRKMDISDLEKMVREIVIPEECTRLEK